MMSQWDSTSQQIPSIIERLVGLRKVHEQATSAVNSIHQIQNDQTAVSELLKETTASYTQLESAFEDNKKIIQKNVESLEERMRALEEKISKM